MQTLLGRRGPLPYGQFSAAVYFADGLENKYQLEQWYEPLARLAVQAPLAVLARESSTAHHLLRHCSLPVQYADSIASIERWVAQNPLKAVFYVNQNARNFPMLRFRKPAHVFLSHGESEKDYMVSNQLKAYDYAFVAGPAAKERLRRSLTGFDVDARTIEIGRPQIDVTYSGPELRADDRVVVLYAPTWEGDRPSMQYSSLLPYGKELIESLLRDRRFRIIYRPHPRTGLMDSRYKAAHASVARAIRRANDLDDTAQHMVDTATRFGWHLQRADVCIADISAVAYDWLATGRPLVLTTPASPDAVVSGAELATTLTVLGPDDAVRIRSVIDSAFSQTSDKARRRLAAHYFGDTTPGASMRRFLDGAQRVIDERNPASPSATGKVAGLRVSTGRSVREQAARAI